MSLYVPNPLPPPHGTQAVAAAGTARDIEVGKKQNDEYGNSQPEGSPHEVTLEGAKQLQESAGLEILCDGEGTPK